MKADEILVIGNNRKKKHLNYTVVLLGCTDVLAGVA
jgi:hypothetical protein